MDHDGAKRPQCENLAYVKLGYMEHVHVCADDMSVQTHVFDIRS